MINDLTVAAVIPARAGSKGIPRKNLVPLHGRPLIQWTIDAARASRYVDTIVVSTDDPDVAALAARSGLTVVERPAALAGDASTAADVIAHILDTGLTEDLVVYLQPTSPLRTAVDIDRSLEALVGSDCEGVVSVTRVTEPPEWMYRFGDGGPELVPVLPGPLPPRRQELPDAVRLNGAVYCATQAALRPDGNFLRLRLAGYEMPWDRSVDIDDADDLHVADTLLSDRLTGGASHA